MIGKKIYRYTNVELFDVIKNSSNKLLVNKAKDEFKNRNLTKGRLKQVEIDYLKYKEFQKKRKDKPLTENEWITFFFLPFFTTKPRWREDHFSESEFERFKKYGFNKKLKQARRVKTFGYAFWFFITVLAVFLFIYLKK